VGDGKAIGPLVGAGVADYDVLVIGEGSDVRFPGWQHLFAKLGRHILRQLVRLVRAFKNSARDQRMSQLRLEKMKQITRRYGLGRERKLNQVSARNGIKVVVENSRVPKLPVRGDGRVAAECPGGPTEMG
jgi:hypothetical protein